MIYTVLPGGSDFRLQKTFQPCFELLVGVAGENHKKAEAGKYKECNKAPCSSPGGQQPYVICHI